MLKISIKSLILKSPFKNQTMNTLLKNEEKVKKFLDSLDNTKVILRVWSA